MLIIFTRDMLCAKESKRSIFRGVSLEVYYAWFGKLFAHWHTLVHPIMMLPRRNVDHDRAAAASGI